MYIYDTYLELLPEVVLPDAPEEAGGLGGLFFVVGKEGGMFL